MQHFETILPGTCCLCGSAGPLSGEHKFKHAALRAQFGDGDVVFGRFGGGGFHPVQSLRSRRLHFGARLCAPCNNARTQSADRSFDHFNRAAHPSNVGSLNQTDGLAPDGDGVARYFAKLLVCHMADVAPVRWQRLAAFVIDPTVDVGHQIDIGEDPVGQTLRADVSEYGYAAHGGLGTVWSRSLDSVTSFRSSLTFGRRWYLFSFDLSANEISALRGEQPAFWALCRDAALSPDDDPERALHLQRLGF